MDIAGWIQVTSIIGALIVILSFYGKIVRESAKTKAAADKANERLDTIEENKGVCVMGAENRKRIETLESENKTTAVEISAIKTDIKNIKGSVDEMKTDLKKVLIAVSK